MDELKKELLSNLELIKDKQENNEPVDKYDLVVLFLAASLEESMVDDV